MESDWYQVTNPIPVSHHASHSVPGPPLLSSPLPSFTKTQLLPLFLTAMFDICKKFHKIEIFV